MNKIFLLLLVVSSCLYSSEYGAESAKVLTEKIKKSADDKSIDQFLLCTCWDRLSDSLKERFKNTTPTFMTKKLISIEVKENEPDPYSALAGFKYNIDYKGVIVLKYDGLEEVAKMPYGMYNGKYYLATLVKDKK